jgi:hypothetical protein
MQWQALILRAWGDRSVLELVKPSIAPSTINDIKTTGIPLFLRAQESPGASLNAWVWEDC